MPHFVYMLKCRGNRIYTGYATDVEKRYEAHKLGKGAKFTKAFPPQRILKIFELETKHEALRLEALIKFRPRDVKEACTKLPKGTLPDFFAENPKKKKNSKKEKA